MTAVTAEQFGQLPDGRAVERWVLTASSGAAVAVLTYGGTIQSIRLPDAHGRIAEVALGFATLADYIAPEYLAANPFFGSTVGRFANRLAGGRFEIDGREYRIPANEGANALHGGAHGFDQQLWEASVVPDGVVLAYTSPDGEQGFPGKLDVSVAFTLDDTSCLRLEYRATTDAPTVVNLTNHTYWNLTGAGSGTAEDHRLTLAANAYLPVNDALLPTGAIELVQGTPFDFRSPRAVGESLRDGHPQLVRCRGFDHNVVLTAALEADGLRPAAVLEDPVSGRRLTIRTSEPGLQVYTGNFLDGTLRGWDGRQYRQGDAVALEPQHFPDSPNRPDFPPTALWPGVEYRSTTTYAFG